MLTRSKPLSVFATLFFCVGFVFAKPAPTQEIEKHLSGWKFEQVSVVDGPFRLVIVDSAIKANFPLRHFVYLCAAPSWTPVLFNERTKLKVTFKPDNYWSGFHIGDDTKTTAVGTPKTVKGDWQGKPTLIVTRPVSTSDPMREQLEMLYRDGAQRSRELKEDQITQATWPKLKPEIMTFVRNFFRMKELNGVMLKRVHHYTKGKDDVMLDTKACVPVTISASEILYPVGYREEKKLAIVVGDEKRNKEAVGVFEDLFEDSKSPRKDNKASGSKSPTGLNGR